MRALAALAALSSGCFTSWAVIQATGAQRFLDEGARDEAVPQPGIDERFSVSLPLAIEYEPAAGSMATTSTALPFALTCSTKQFATDRVYHSAFRYGSKWKKTAGVSFLLEAAIAAAGLLLDRNRDLDDPMTANDRSGLVAGAFFAVDAIGTAAIFFIPRKEVFTVETKAVVTPIRDDCPDGLVLEIAGDAFPVDALGKIGELGEVALDEWMKAPTGTIALTFHGRALPLRLEAREQCAWMRARHADDIEGTRRACGPQLQTVPPRFASAIISVPAGSLSMATEPTATTDSR